MVGPPLRVALLQRVCPSYRAPLFRALAAHPGVEEFRLIIGGDIPDSKVRSAKDLSGLPVTRLPTRFYRLAGRVVPHHLGLGDALRAFSPDVIVAEGESNVLSYLSAARVRAEAGAALVHWSLGVLPGVSLPPHRRWAKRLLYDQADTFATYSSFGREALIHLGCPPDRIFVATNVGDTLSHHAAARSLTLSPSEARRTVGIPDRFTVMFLGALEEVKRPRVLLDAAGHLADVNFIFLGRGPMLEDLSEAARTRGMEHVRFFGHVSEGLETTFRAADVLALPGRGGMVISEAMAHGVPVIVHQADGTERDLVEHGRTGWRLESASPNDLVAAICALRDDPQLLRQLGARAQERVTTRFTLDGVVDGLMKAIRAAWRRRTR